MKWYDKTFNELTTKELFAILKLRAQVFNDEQASSYPDPDDNDLVAHHVFVLADGVLLAYGRYFKIGEKVTFGRVVVAPAARGKGLGGKIVEHLLDGIKENYPESPVIIHAQAYVEGFYQKYGFQAQGDHFMEADREHVTMVHQPLKEEGNSNR